ncbi:MAG TPA: heavy metal-binding domain-containing protein [Candidatus Obscuribacter sp.]|nr:heavy metal-binding domain-containing protein [Candidatus Obscuribacter sp.]
MPFWIFKEKDDDKAKRELQEASVKELEKGNLPLGAQHRLKAQAESGKNFFSSNLSAKEYLLAREAGYVPVGQVMGSAFMKVGWRNFCQGFWSSTSEISALTNAHKQARELAVSRLRQEAELLGAHGVIGVKVTTSTFNWGEGITEFTAMGTAIRIPGSACVKPGHVPFTSTLSGQEFWQLYEAGFWPTGLVMGNCSYYIKGNRQSNSAQMGWFGSLANQELMVFSEGFAYARKQANQRLWIDIGLNGGDGAVDMTVDYKLERIEYESNRVTFIDMLVNFMAMGTAVVDRPDGKKRISPSPLIVIDLSRRGKSDVEFDEPLSNYVATASYGAEDDYDDDE